MGDLRIMVRVVGLVRAGICIFLLPLLAGAPAQGATVSLTPSADTFVSSAQPDGNFGAAGALEISASGLPKGEFQSVIRFNTAAAKSTFDATFGAGNWNLQSASLALTAASPNNVIFNANAAGTFNVSWLLNDSWLEGTGAPGAATADGITFNTLSTFLSPADRPLAALSYSGASAGTTTYGLTLDSAFANDVSGGNDVSLRLFSADAAMSYVMNSRNFGNPAARPTLILNAIAIPEPALAWTIWIFLPLIGKYRRSRRGAAARTMLSCCTSGMPPGRSNR